MTGSVFDLDDRESLELFLDWLCHYVYATYEPVRQLVDSGRAPTVVVCMEENKIFDPSRARLFAHVVDTTIHVEDEWVAPVERGQSPLRADLPRLRFLDG